MVIRYISGESIFLSQLGAKLVFPLHPASLGFFLDSYGVLRLGLFMDRPPQTGHGRLNMMTGLQVAPIVLAVVFRCCNPLLTIIAISTAFRF